MNNENISLPLLETIKRSMSYVLFNWKLFFSITGIWFLAFFVDYAIGFKYTRCILDLIPNNWEMFISVLALLLTSSAVSVAYSRALILKETIDYKVPFWKGVGKYLAYVLLLITCIIFSAVLIEMLLDLASFNKYTKVVMSSVVLPVFMFGMLGVFMRVALVFPAACVGDKSMTIKKSYLLTKGNVLKMFFGSFAVSVLATIGLHVFKTVFVFLGLTNIYAVAVFLLIVLFFTYLDVALKSSFYAHAYQYFVYYSNKKEAEIIEE